VREKAVVVATKSGFAQLQIEPKDSCEGCKACAAGKSGKAIKIWAKNYVNAKVGQTVEVELRDSTFLSATIIIYAIPLLAFFIGIGLGYKVSGIFKIAIIEPFAVVVGVALMAITFLVIHFLTERKKFGDTYSPYITQIYE